MNQWTSGSGWLHVSVAGANRSLWAPTEKCRRAKTVPWGTHFRMAGTAISKGRGAGSLALWHLWRKQLTRDDCKTPCYESRNVTQHPGSSLEIRFLTGFWLSPFLLLLYFSLLGGIHFQKDLLKLPPQNPTCKYTCSWLFSMYGRLTQRCRLHAESPSSPGCAGQATYTLGSHWHIPETIFSYLSWHPMYLSSCNLNLEPEF